MEFAYTQPPSRKRARNVSLVVAKKKRKIQGRKTSRLVIRQIGQIVPDQLVTSLTYASVVQFSPGVGAEDRQFNLNSIFDPDRSGTGHQPMGRDQLTNFYNRYRVSDCRWVVDVMPGAGTGAICSVIIPNNETTSLSSNIETAMETPYAQYKWSNHLATSAATDQRHLQQRGSMHLAKLYGVSDAAQKADDRFQAENGSNPTETAILHCLTVNIDGQAAVYTLSVKLIYTVVMFDRVQLAAS